MPDAKKVIKTLKDLKFNVVPNTDKLNALDFAIETIEATERLNYICGDWIPKEIDTGIFDLYTTTYFYECSHCRMISRIAHNYCPNCGYKNKLPDGWTDS